MHQLKNRHFYDQPFFWDALIVLLLIFSAYSGYWSFVTLQVPHGFVATTMLWISFWVMTIGFILTFYGSYIEPRFLVINHQEITIKNAPPLRIVLASDFHAGTYRHASSIKRIVARINALKPDLIFLLGDFLDDERSALSDLKPLKHLRAGRGIFAVTGNHDAGCYLDLHQHPYCTVDRTKEVEKLLEPMGIHFLQNEHTILEVDGKKIAIAGIDDAFMKECDLKNAIVDIPKNTPIILLSHNPDIIRDPLSKTCNLIVSGHTHGGQIRLPFIGPLGPIPTRISRKYDQGLFKLNKNCTLFISHGLGETWARARLFCVPEIVVMEVEG